MPKYPLEDLLRVRRFREEAAATEAMLRRRAVVEAEEDLQSRKRELEEYTHWRIRREAELYDQILGQQIQMKELDDLKLNVQILRAREDAYREQILTAKKTLADAETALTQATALHQTTVKDRQKIDEHRRMWQGEMEREAEARQEIELEDFRVRLIEEDDLQEEAIYG